MSSGQLAMQGMAPAASVSSGLRHVPPQQLWTRGLKSLRALLEQVGSESSLELLVKKTRLKKKKKKKTRLAKPQASRFPTSLRTSTCGATPRSRAGPGGAGLIFRWAKETKEDRHPSHRTSETSFAAPGQRGNQFPGWGSMNLGATPGPREVGVSTEG